MTTLYIAVIYINRIYVSNFHTRFSSETDAVTWYLAYPLSNMRFEVTASVLFDISCTGDEIPEEQVI